MQSYEESLKNLLSRATPWTLSERVSLSVAKGRILASDVCAEENYPSAPTAAMDGYACKHEDLELGKLKVVGILPAGTIPSVKISNGECVKTFTGALMSEGSDTLIQIENVSVNGDKIIVNSLVPKFNAVRCIGESYKKGDLLLERGRELGFSEVALLAELGLGYVDVLTKPRVAIIGTGSEILDLGQKRLNAAQIYSSNGIAIANLVLECGCEPVNMPIVRDDKRAINDALNSAFRSCDFVITIGGVSVGDFDFMREFARNNEIIVDCAEIKPGRHVKVAKVGEKFLFALPGFAYSAEVTFLLYFREFIKAIFSLKKSYKFSAILSEDYEKRSNFLEFSAANLSNESGVLKISTQGKKRGSSAISVNLLGESILLICPKEKSGLKKGEVVEFIQK